MKSENLIESIIMDIAVIVESIPSSILNAFIIVYMYI